MGEPPVIAHEKKHFDVCTLLARAVTTKLWKDATALHAYVEICVDAASLPQLPRHCSALCARWYCDPLFFSPHTQTTPSRAHPTTLSPVRAWARGAQTQRQKPDALRATARRLGMFGGFCKGRAERNNCSVVWFGLNELSLRGADLLGSCQLRRVARADVVNTQLVTTTKWEEAQNIHLLSTCCKGNSQ